MNVLNEAFGICNTFEDALELTGYGKFHYFLFGLCSLCLMCSGFQSGLASYIFASAEEELGISSVELGFLHMAYMIGTVVSALFWGVMADLFGRRRVLLIALPLDFLVTTICCAVPTFNGILICRFLSGFLSGAPSSITLTYLGEFYSEKIRVRYLCYCSVFFTVSWLLLPIICFFVLPLNISLQIGGLQLTSWRCLLFFLGLPELLGTVWLAVLPESPKFWYNKGEFKKTLEILKSIYKVNEIKNSDYRFPVIYLTGTKKCENVGEGKISRLFGELYTQIIKLFHRPHNYMVLLVSGIFFTNMFGYFGLGLWLPQLFEKIHIYKNKFPQNSISLHGLSTFNETAIAEDNYKDTDMLLNNTLVWLSCIVGNILSGYYSKSVNLKVIPTLTMVIGCISSLCLFWLNASWQYLFISCIFQTAMVTGNMALASSTVVYFPTSISAMALCITLLAGRTGAIFSAFAFGYLLDKSCEIPIFLVSGIVLFGAVLCCFLPTKPTNK